jgi:small conductance mechanosensitive channel
MSVQLTIVAAALVALLAAALVVRIGRSAILRLLSRLDIVDADNREAVHARAKQLTSALTFLAFGVATVVTISFALSRLGVGNPEWEPRAVGRWLTTHGINVIVIVAGAYVAIRAAHLGIEHLQFKIGRHHSQGDLEWQRRSSTVSGVLSRVVTAAVGFIAVLMLLRELTIDVVPLLTGAGIAGLAIGFGAQNLVRDVISGFFMILEDRVRIGDLARINGVAGIVEHISLRTIALRDGEGAVQVFPNGTITALANLSKLFSYAIVDLRVAYSENFDRVIGTVREVAASMERDPAWSGVLLAPLEVLGIESLDGGAATLRVRFKVLPLNQGRVANELRKRLIGVLVARGIRPYAS